MNASSLPPRLSTDPAAELAALEARLTEIQRETVELEVRIRELREQLSQQALTHSDQPAT